MEAKFWHARWKNNETGFHETAPNEFLVRHFPRLDLREGSRVFVPLCGKAFDLQWIADQGHLVVGVELSRLAVEAFFDSADAKFEIDRTGDLSCYRSDTIEIFCGDIFALTPEVLGAVDATYDRAALVALPSEMRRAYAKQLVSLTSAAPQLLVSFEYDQSQTEGPPFSVARDEIDSLYGDCYDCEIIDSSDISGPLATRCSGSENTFLMYAK